tara:strand:- start:95 stop:943 length:849 start_codon:yes stop_codon:yes gene_type:complete
MKMLLISVFITFFLVSKGQYCHPKEGEVLNGLYVPSHRDFNVVSYPHLREADVMWSKRIWRVLDLREKINHSLYFPVDPIPSRTSYMQMIMHYLTCENAEITLTPYDILDDEFTVRLTKSEVIAKSFSKEEFAFENEDGDMETREVDNPFEFSSVKRLRLKEEWFFDNQRSVMETRIIGVCPVMEMFDEMGEYKGEKPLVWLYFPELRIPMSITAMFNTKNRAATITYDQLFMKRMFSSYIYKKSNVFDRKIDTYKQDLDLLLESKQIEHEIFEFEQDLWEY